jgi:dTDP-4-dehydrorhamnose reductase
MKTVQNKHRILILGGSGFLGGAIYKELCAYFKTFATYCTPNSNLDNNHQFFEYNFEEDDIYDILAFIKPSIIISSLRGDFSKQVLLHQHLTEYVYNHEVKLLFLSSANVFDAYSKFPSYEEDKTLSNSVFGHFKIKIENMLLRLPKAKVAILRLPMVFGSQSPRIQEITQHIKEGNPVEIFPNLIMNVAIDSKVTQQIHYIINRNKYGVFHLGTTDLIHHDDFIKDMVRHLMLDHNVQYKRVYTTNDERYLAVLPKFNPLPKHLNYQSSFVLKDVQLP